MNNNSTYYLGKLQEAINILTTHPGDARYRLRACWTPFCLAGAGIPEHLREEFKAIKGALIKRRYCRPAFDPDWERSGNFWVNGEGWVEADSLYGRMVHTTRTMRTQTAARLAERILTLSLQWESWLKWK